MVLTRHHLSFIKDFQRVAACFGQSQLAPIIGTLLLVDAEVNKEVAANKTENVFVLSLALFNQRNGDNQTNIK